MKEFREAINEIAIAEIHRLSISHRLSGSDNECDSGSDVEEAKGILTDEVKAILIEVLV